MENYIDNTYCKHFEEKDKTVFLTKRINKNDTIISWEIGTFMESEKRQMFEFNKHSKKYKIHKPKPYVKDDEEWGNTIGPKMMNIQEYVWNIITIWGLPQKLTISSTKEKMVNKKRN